MVGNIQYSSVLVLFFIQYFLPIFTRDPIILGHTVYRQCIQFTIGGQIHDVHSANNLGSLMPN